MLTNSSFRSNFISRPDETKKLVDRLNETQRLLRFASWHNERQDTAMVQKQVDQAYCKIEHMKNFYLEHSQQLINEIEWSASEGDVCKVSELCSEISFCLSQLED